MIPIRNKNEEWYGSVTSGWSNADYDVFLNPSRNELNKEFHKNHVRFIALDASREVYVFSADIIHSDVWDVLFPNKPVSLKNSFWGVANFQLGTGYSVIFSDTLDPRYGKGIPLMKKIVQGKYDWLERYFCLSNVKDMIIREIPDI